MTLLGNLSGHHDAKSDRKYIGALIGARLLTRMSNKTLRFIFLPVIALSAFEMILHGMGIGPF